MGAALSWHEHTVFFNMFDDAVSAACNRSMRYAASFRNAQQVLAYWDLEGICIVVSCTSVLLGQV